MTNPFQIQFTLRQHTPIIHFHEQEGATLRATELKPKLDKYLINELFKNDFNQFKTYLIGYSERTEKDLKKRYDTEGYMALDYKVSLTAENTWQHDIEILRTEKGEPKRSEKTGKLMYDNFPLFFANIGDEPTEIPKKFAFSDSISGNFFSKNSKIIELLKTHFATFLLKTAFGTRQSKGFGCFYLIKSPDFVSPQPALKYKFSISTQVLDRDLNTYIKDFEVKFNGIALTWTKEQIEQRGKEYFIYKDLFQKIDYFYKSLRSGINQNKFYFKSLIFLYAKNQMKINGQTGVQWEKRSIKQLYFSNNLEEHKRRHDDTEFSEPLYYFEQPRWKWKLVKDLFGLSSREEWKEQHATIIKVNSFKNGKDDRGFDKFDARENNDPKLIARFKSPIHFFIFRKSDLEFDVYFDFSPFPNGYLGQWFNITPKDVKKNKLSLQLPTAFEFSFDSFFSYILSPTNFNIETYVQNPNHEIAIKLKKIFDDIRKNLNHAQ